MKIILLAGRKNSGKTTTMHKVYDFLSAATKTKPKKNPISIKMPKDFHCEFTYKKNRVALFSSGDTLHLLLEGIFIYSDADYLIIPFSTGGAIKTKVLSSFRACKNQIPINKTVSPKNAAKTVQDKANDKDCKSIAAAI